MSKHTNFSALERTITEFSAPDRSGQDLQHTVISLARRLMLAPEEVKILLASGELAPVKGTAFSADDLNGIRSQIVDQIAAQTIEQMSVDADPEAVNRAVAQSLRTYRASTDKAINAFAARDDLRGHQLVQFCAVHAEKRIALTRKVKPTNFIFGSSYDPNRQEDPGLPRKIASTAIKAGLLAGGAYVGNRLVHRAGGYKAVGGMAVKGAGALGDKLAQKGAGWVRLWLAAKAAKAAAKVASGGVV
ncbi:MAG: hypothetical protein SFY80_00820 [Verrucomicrobiota bacterium]|nr:hypothetical protein [Verrucomicrobiota bacterium]